MEKTLTANGEVKTAVWWNWGVVHALARAAGVLHRGLYRVSGGRMGGSASGVPVVLLSTRGRRSGRVHTWPVCCVAEGDDLVVIASAGGNPRNPGWYHNLRANPNVTVQVGHRSRAMVAEPQTGPAREAYWARVVRQHPAFEGYQRKVSRRIPVVLLRPAT
jgi:deazaflavin-dependent oxidoreductase (nitroreductase family)